MSREQQKNDADAEDCSSREMYSRRSKSRSGSARRSARSRKNSYDYFNAVQLLGKSVRRPIVGGKLIGFLLTMW